MAKFEGKILVIGLGSVSRCTIPLLFRHIEADPKNITVIDFSPDTCESAKDVIARGANFFQEKLGRDTLEEQLANYVGPGDMIIDLAWNIDCGELIEWCHNNGVRYVNTSIEVWDPYEGAEDKTPQDRTLYARHMNLRKRMSKWPSKKGPTAILDHGANPGLVQHFTKVALETMARQWLGDYTTPSSRRDRIAEGLKVKAYNRLSMELGVKVIHVSERDTQITNQPKEVNEFVNTWSIEGFREEGIAPAEMGWGTHERICPPRAMFHSRGPMNQICLAQMGCRTWVRSWVPCGEIVGMVIRHGEAFSISEYLTVTRNSHAIYRPTVHYAYMPCDAAIASLLELQTRNYELQPKLRIMGDEIVSGGDELGCLLMGHDYDSWWIGSLLTIEEARKIVPHQNATTLQVAASVVSAALWMIDNPNEGVLLPDQQLEPPLFQMGRPQAPRRRQVAVHELPGEQHQRRRLLTSRATSNENAPATRNVAGASSSVLPTLCLSHQRCRAFRADAHHADGRPDQLFQALDVLLGIGGQSLEGTDMGYIFLPAGEGFVNRLDIRKNTHVRLEGLNRLAMAFVPGADLDLIQAAEHIQKRQGDGRHPAQIARIAHRHRVKPAAAAGPARGGAIFIAAFANVLPDVVVLFRGEWSAADARRIGLHNAHEIAADLRRHPGSRVQAQGRTRRAGDIREGAVVDIQQYRMCAFKENAFAGPKCLEEDSRGVGHKGL